MAAQEKNKKAKRLICLCNGVSQETIENAIQRGCTSLGKIFDATSAGVGACGGTCQPILRKMLDDYLTTGNFPEDPRPGFRKRRRER